MGNEALPSEVRIETVNLPDRTSTELWCIRNDEIVARLGNLSTHPFFSQGSLAPSDRETALAEVLRSEVYDALTSGGMWNRYSLVAIGEQTIVGVTVDARGDEAQEVLSTAIHHMLQGNYLLFAPPFDGSEPDIEEL
jgi:hypothetical protein